MYILKIGDDMKLKTSKIVGLLIVFLLCFPLHFLYDFIPNFFTSIIAPINESIWEHMKLIYTSYVIYGIFEYFILKKENKNNYFLQLFLVPIFGICIYLIIYLPIFNIFDENLVVSITLLFIVIAIEQLISYFLMKKDDFNNSNILSIIGIVAVYVIFAYLTYFPLNNYIFWPN